MLRRMALGVPRFSMSKPRLSFSTRRRIWPKFDRACRAEITTPLFFAVFSAGIKSPVRVIEPYSLQRPLSTFCNSTGCRAEARRYVNPFATREEKGVTSAKMEGQGLQQCFDSVPGNLHADTNQEKGRHFGDHGHARCSQDSRQAVGKSIAE